LPFDTEKVLDKVKQEFRAFVGQTAFEELAQQWVIERGRAGKLPLAPDAVGSHWSRRAQVDVVAVSWQGRQALVGECKWGQEAVSREVVRELIGRKAEALKHDLPDGGEGWRMVYALFSRAGFTQAARDELRAHGGLAIDLARLDDDLGRTPEV
jgi:hypothetical protein